MEEENGSKGKPMIDLHDAIRNGTAAGIVAAVTKSHLYNQTNVLAEAIVAARDKPENVVHGIVKWKPDVKYVEVPGNWNQRDRVTITREKTCPQE